MAKKIEVNPAVTCPADPASNDLLIKRASCLKIDHRESQVKGREDIIAAARVCHLPEINRFGEWVRDCRVKGLSVNGTTANGQREILRGGLKVFGHEAFIAKSPGAAVKRTGKHRHRAIADCELPTTLRRFAKRLFSDTE